MLVVGLFSCAKTMYKLLWHNKNAKHHKSFKFERKHKIKQTYLDLIGKLISVGKMTVYDICEVWLNP